MWIVNRTITKKTAYISGLLPITWIKMTVGYSEQKDEIPLLPLTAAKDGVMLDSKEL